MINRIRNLRRAQKMTQGDLGKLLDVAQTTISTWERGYHQPDAREIAKMCDIFNVTEEHLLGTDEPMPDPNETPETEDPSDIEEMLAAQLPGGMRYDEISMEGMMEMMKFYKYLKHAYPRKPDKK